MLKSIFNSALLKTCSDVKKLNQKKLSKNIDKTDVVVVAPKYVVMENVSPILNLALGSLRRNICKYIQVCYQDEANILIARFFVGHKREKGP